MVRDLQQMIDDKDKAIDVLKKYSGAAGVINTIAEMIQVINTCKFS